MAIPNRPVFRAQEVCELADVQPYVLRTWEAEFPDLGVAKTPGGPRVYRRADVERVLRIKHLLFVDGLTLAGARRRLSEETASTAAEDGAVSDADVAALLDETTRQQLPTCVAVCRGFSACSSGNGVTPEDFVLTAPAAGGRPAPRRAARAVAARSAQGTKSAKPSPRARRRREEAAGRGRRRSAACGRSALRSSVQRVGM